MVPPYDYGGRDGAVGHQLVEAEACPVALACPEPADACGEALELDLLAGLRDPTHQTLVVRKELQDRIVRRRYVRLLARERGPPERPLALAEKRPDVRGHEPWIAVSILEAAEPGLPAQGVTVVEDLGAPPGNLPSPRSGGPSRRGLPRCSAPGQPRAVRPRHQVHSLRECSPRERRGRRSDP